MSVGITLPILPIVPFSSGSLFKRRTGDVKPFTFSKFLLKNVDDWLIPDDVEIETIVGPNENLNQKRPREDPRV